MWEPRASARDSAADHRPVPGSNSSAVKEEVPTRAEPAMTSTRPEESRVAVCAVRASTSEPAADQLFVAGSYNSAVEIRVAPWLPPETSTLPEGRSVAECQPRASASEPAGDQAPV